jgi:hypothetical protein
MHGDEVATRVRKFLDDAAVVRLDKYFNGKNKYDRPFTGRRFERLCGGGDRPETANHFTGDDLVAVSMLGIVFDAEAAIAILETDAEELNSLLVNVPNGVSLWEVDRAVVDDGSDADRLWNRLTDIREVGPVTAGKLLARKRPQLIPIYDDFVDKAMAAGHRWWVSLRDALQDKRLRDQLEQLRALSNIGDDISLLRVLDISIWMAKGIAPT